MITAEQFAGDFLGGHEGEGDYTDDPRIEMLVGALQKAGVEDLGAILGSGSFGVAASFHGGRYGANRVAKLTADVEEVQSSAVLLGKKLPNVVEVFGSWFVKGVKTRVSVGWDDKKDEPIEKPARVGLIIQARVETVTYDEPGARELNAFVRRAKDTFHVWQGSKVKVRDNLRRASEWLSEELLQEYEDTGHEMLRDVGLALSQLRSVGIYGIDMHNNNVGYDSDEGVIKVFDIGVSSSPKEPKAKTLTPSLPIAPVAQVAEL